MSRRLLALAHEEEEEAEELWGSCWMIDRSIMRTNRACHGDRSSDRRVQQPFLI
jgi:hypothetical protein